jgi:phenylpropionate dioxygenase-like ring-hydroxylating dioxygenase large terminal subunit
MRFAYYDRLSAARKKIYRRSDEIVTLGIPLRLELGGTVLRIGSALSADDRAAVQRACQSLIDALAEGYHVPAVRVRILARRPADSSGELHGLYEPEEGRTAARITAWMRTAQKQQVVAFKTFLRTVIHELCHHLDYELFALEETFHTEGFYKRESSLVAALLAQRGAPIGAARPG